MQSSRVAAMSDVLSRAFAAGVLFVGSAVLSTVGFGIGMTSIPALLFVFDAQTAVVVVNTVSIALFVLIVHRNRAELPFREVLPWSVSGLLAAPVGALALRGADAAALKIAITALTIALTIAVASGVKTPVPRGKAAGVAVGFAVSATLNALGVGGPIMALYVFAQRWRRDSARGALALYFLFVESAGVGVYAAVGLLTWERMVIILISVPAVVCGFVVGSRLASRMSDVVFRRATVAAILTMCALALAREIAGLYGWAI